MSAFIRLHRGVLPPETCAAIIEKFDADPRKVNPHVSLGGFHRGKSSLDLRISIYEDWKPLDGLVEAAIGRSFAQYRIECPAIEYAVAGVPIRDVGYQIQAYMANGVDRFDWHVDIGGRREPTGGYTATRILACVLYLNTVLEGGETEFAIQQLSFKPEAGALLWFPVSFEYVHRGRIPVSGPKYIVSTFMSFGE